MKGMIIVNEEFFNFYIFGSDDKAISFYFHQTFFKWKRSLPFFEILKSSSDSLLDSSKELFSLLDSFQ